MLNKASEHKDALSNEFFVLPFGADKVVVDLGLGLLGGLMEKERALHRPRHMSRSLSWGTCMSLWGLSLLSLPACVHIFLVFLSSRYIVVCKTLALKV